MKSELTESEAAEFQQALLMVVMQDMSFADFLGGESPEDMLAAHVNKVDGMSAEDIFEQAAEIEEKKKAEARVKAVDEIAELQSLRSQAESAKAELAKFEVLESKFYKRREGSYYVRYKPTIYLKVKNGTQHPIKRVHFNATLSSPDRSVPWTEDDLSYEVPGGVEPGEVVEWRLEPNLMSDWHDAEVIDGADFNVYATELNGADDEVLYSTMVFGDEQQSRLDELQSEYPDL